MQNQPRTLPAPRPAIARAKAALLILASAALAGAGHAQTAGFHPAKSFVDYFLPTPPGGPLRADVWGAPDVGPRDPDNGLEDRTMKKWNYWDGQILRGKDGRYHLFASRWDQSKGHGGWGGRRRSAR